MKDLVYPHERTLGTITLILGILAWIGLIVGTVGIALIFLGLGFILYLFAQSALIAYIRGNGVLLTETQFPDLHAQFVECCDKLELKERPEVYILNGEGGLNAFATKFLGRQFVVLLSSVVDAMDKHEDGVKFYIGHELGHLRMKHLNGHLLRWPVLWLPLLGAAYGRAQESTCDRHGLACCATPQGGARALAALSAGVERWKSIDIPTYLQQLRFTSGFWMSFHELVGGYPWLSKRVARVMDLDAPMPKRSVFAYLLALFVPYAGRLGAGFGALIMIYIIAMLAAIAVPSYNQYLAKVELSKVVLTTQEVRNTLGRYYDANQAVPDSLQDVGIAEMMVDGTTLTLDTDSMELIVTSKKGALIFTPTLDDNDKIVWSCSGGEDLPQAHLPPNCKQLD